MGRRQHYWCALRTSSPINRGTHLMLVYHVYIERDGAEKWIALDLLSSDQAELLGKAFPDITRIETWLGDVVYTSKRKQTVH